MPDMYSSHNPTFLNYVISIMKQGIGVKIPHLNPSHTAQKADQSQYPTNFVDYALAVG